MHINPFVSQCYHMKVAEQGKLYQDKLPNITGTTGHYIYHQRLWQLVCLYEVSLYLLSCLLMYGNSKWQQGWGTGPFWQWKRKEVRICFPLLFCS